MIPPLHTNQISHLGTYERWQRNWFQSSGGQDSADLFEEHPGRKRFLKEPQRLDIGTQKIALAQATGHQDSQLRMRQEATLDKPVWGHRVADVVHDQEIWGLILGG